MSHEGFQILGGGVGHEGRITQVRNNNILSTASWPLPPSAPRTPPHPPLTHFASLMDAIMSSCRSGSTTTSTPKMGEEEYTWGGGGGAGPGGEAATRSPSPSLLLPHAHRSNTVDSNGTAYQAAGREAQHQVKSPSEGAAD